MNVPEQYRVDNEFLSNVVKTMVLNNPVVESTCLTDSLIIIKTLFGKEYLGRNYYRQMLAILHFNSILWD